MSLPKTCEGSRSVRLNLKLAATVRLEYGIVENHPAIVKQCIEDGVNVNAVTPGSGVGPLELAFNTRNVSIMRLLLKRGADTKGRNAQGSTTLINACRYGHLECVKLLLEHGANTYTGDFCGKTCLHVALEKGHYSVVSYLLRHDAYDRPISNFKHRGVNLNASFPDDPGLLVFATKHLKNQALRALLETGVDPNIGTKDINFALHEAVRQEDKVAIINLMEHGASTRLLDGENGNPFDIAIRRCCLPMLRLLLDCGADIENSLPFMRIPLTEACRHGFLEGVKFLVRRGANPRARSADGQTRLLVALENKNLSISDYLLELNACEVNGIGRDGLTALHHAVILNLPELMRKLIEKKANVNAQNHAGEVPLYLAVKHNNLNMLCMLLEARADPNVDTKDGDFALHEAVKQGNVEAVKLLLQYGADRARLDKTGMTPVFLAMALVPLLQQVIHCLFTDFMSDEGPSEGASVENFLRSHVGHPAGDKKKISDSEIQQYLCCPITFEIMKDPVIAMDGHTYEREAIETWVRQKYTSPVTRQPLTSSTLIPNLAIKQLIDRFANMNSHPKRRLCILPLNK